jgi:hypothetical protein
MEEGGGLPDPHPGLGILTSSTHIAIECFAVSDQNKVEVVFGPTMIRTQIFHQEG